MLLGTGAGRGEEHEQKPFPCQEISKQVCVGGTVTSYW